MNREKSSEYPQSDCLIACSRVSRTVACNRRFAVAKMVRGKPVRVGCLVTLSNRARIGFPSLKINEIGLNYVPFHTDPISRISNGLAKSRWPRLMSKPQDLPKRWLTSYSYLPETFQTKLGGVSCNTPTWSLVQVTQSGDSLATELSP